jgi:hypothetical protein
MSGWVTGDRSAEQASDQIEHRRGTSPHRRRIFKNSKTDGFPVRTSAHKLGAGVPIHAHWKPHESGNYMSITGDDGVAERRHEWRTTSSKRPDQVSHHDSPVMWPSAS